MTAPQEASASPSSVSGAANDPVILRSYGGLFSALTGPVKEVVAWLGLDLSSHEDWARLVAARNAVRSMVNELPDTPRASASLQSGELTQVAKPHSPASNDASPQSSSHAQAA